MLLDENEYKEKMSLFDAKIKKYNNLVIKQELAKMTFIVSQLQQKYHNNHIVRVEYDDGGYEAIIEDDRVPLKEFLNTFNDESLKYFILVQYKIEEFSNCAERTPRSISVRDRMNKNKEIESIFI